MTALERVEETKERVTYMKEEYVQFKESDEKGDSVSTIESMTIVGSHHEAPDYLKDNEYIVQGYRINFNSTKKVAKSLFMLHNESVNIWSHLLGAILVIILVIYTTIFLKSHQREILDHFKFNLTHVNEEIKHVTTPIIEFLPNLTKSKAFINDFTGSVANKTVEYVGIVEEKIGLYQSYMNCYHCIEDVVHTLKKVKDNLGDHISLYKNILVNESIYIMESIEDSSVIHIIEEFHHKVVNLRDKLTDLIDSHEMNWIDIYENGKEGNTKKLTRWPIFVMLISAIICLSCSCIFHWFGVHSKGMHDLLSRLDYAGISILIAGSCYPPYFYFFYCEQFLRFIYLAFISTFALGVFLYSFKPDFNTPSKRKLRGFLFLTLGLSTAFPILHLALFGKTVVGFEFSPELTMWYLGGISYVTGALIYIMRIPERFRPGKHDIWGSSHQIFHLFVILGVCFHYVGCLDSYYYRINNSCPAS